MTESHPGKLSPRKYDTELVDRATLYLDEWEQSDRQPSPAELMSIHIAKTIISD